MSTGRFRGTVRVYDKEYTDHIITWKDGGGKPIACGPLRVEFRILQGNRHMADPEDFARVNRKLLQIGGLYVYRDRIRILPYGNSDVDWLDIEQRRNKGLTYYFFSYRRIYGAVCLTRESNASLREKAGREGFQKDKAYRHFKNVLENLFVQFAAGFLPEGSAARRVLPTAQRGTGQAGASPSKTRTAEATTKRSNLAGAFNVFFSKISEKMPESEIAALRHHVHARMQLASEMTDPDDASRELLEAEREANQEDLPNCARSIASPVLVVSA